MVKPLIPAPDYTIDISKYLPEDIELADSNASSVIITVTLEKDGTKNF